VAKSALSTKIAFLHINSEFKLPFSSGNAGFLGRNRPFADYLNYGKKIRE